MDYRGKYEIFEPAQIRTYPLRTRSNKVTLADLVRPSDIDKIDLKLAPDLTRDTETVAHRIVESRKADKPVVIFTGAHLMKNGLGPLLVDLVNRKMVTLIAGNAATAIHDFELALIGQTSENVPNALGKGQFGMAHEFAYINCALSLANQRKLGFGEALGKMICDQDFRNKVLAVATAAVDSHREFPYSDISVLAACYRNNVPCTIHAGIGTDVTDQHPSFDGQAKGGCSARDFLIFTQHITKFTTGGVILNIGSAVTGPEVLLKAVSMAANVGFAPKNILTADFDLRGHNSADMNDESAQCYYYRDQKSVVTRIPQAFAGVGLYIRGNQRQTFPCLYKLILKNL